METQVNKEPKKSKSRKNLKVAKPAKIRDNVSQEAPERTVTTTIPVVFQSESKEAVETCRDSESLIVALQNLVLKYQKEIQAVGNVFKIKLEGRVVFNAQKLKE